MGNRGGRQIFQANKWLAIVAGFNRATLRMYSSYLETTTNDKNPLLRRLVA